MMNPFFFQKPTTPEERQREKLVQDAEELKQHLNKMTPEARAEFWADVEGKSDDQEQQMPKGN